MKNNKIICFLAVISFYTRKLYLDAKFVGIYDRISTSGDRTTSISYITLYNTMVEERTLY
jgi:hypothetical protein